MFLYSKELNIRNTVLSRKKTKIKVYLILSIHLSFMYDKNKNYLENEPSSKLWAN